MRTTSPDEKQLQREARRRELMARADTLQLLTKHPSWEALKEEVAKKRARDERFLLAELMHGNVEDLRRKVDTARGFDLGMNYVIQMVEQAKKTLEKEIERAAAFDALQEGVTPSA